MPRKNNRVKVSFRSKGFRMKLRHTLRIHWRNQHLKHQKYKCFYCPKDITENATLDHKMPLSRGGRDHFENTVACCHKCNQRKGAMTVEEFEAKRKAA